MIPNQLIASLFVLTTFVGAGGPASSEPVALDLTYGTVVFDFENGLEGWTTQGSATRVATSILGGDFAVFGDGFAGVDITFPLPNGDAAALTLEVANPAPIVAVELDLFYLGDAYPYTTPLVASVALDGLFAFVGLEAIGDPTSNPRRIRTRAFNNDELPLVSLTLRWHNTLFCASPCPDARDLLLAMIDNVTLIPEPSSGLSAFDVLISLGALALVSKT